METWLVLMPDVKAPRKALVDCTAIQHTIGHSIPVAEHETIAWLHVTSVSKHACRKPDCTADNGVFAGGAPWIKMTAGMAGDSFYPT